MLQHNPDKIVGIVVFKSFWPHLYFIQAKLYPESRLVFTKQQSLVRALLP